mmetsp:Transcript_29671/g.63563  ORF Transcript_29671/g.63563 Transcript_29671/m.63563 type:complete len:236 (+) Transcript_29671:59-766(+)|eukprot:CAMPEP_0201116176 /NCGR_PEP_ID=MMETSP0850-20130426/533_1 /ASSEMBLY_ACC=CAM_ASM_000622 /TAXON_ID=183588 /ORGANISM="Pseudo-nitzschia fraudulenta, Strain WWA7" /LENGTH=235 /DNA_ID=CAMNT_0047380193 /DNA_START=35 /DNA_END=742 /DNA_ORIENTATION=+
MAEVQENPTVSLENADTLQQVDSLDTNGEPMMSKSKARSLRRKRAKQRKKKKNASTEIEGEKKEESQDKENHGVAAQENQDVKKKKKPRRRKKKKKTGEGVKQDDANGDSTEAPDEIPKMETDISEEVVETPAPVVSDPILVETPALEPVVADDNTETQDPVPVPKDDILNVEAEVQEPEPEMVSAPAKKEIPAVYLGEIQESASISDTAPTSVYEDDNVTKEGKKEDCCACIIS